MAVQIMLTATALAAIAIALTISAYSMAVPDQAHAAQLAPSAKSTASAVVDSGTWGTCAWQYSKNGTLTVFPGTGGTPRPQFRFFYYDKAYELIDALSNVPWENHRDVAKIVFEKQGSNRVVLPADARGLFWGLGKLKSIDFSGADASRVTNMSHMFSNCKSLAKISLAKLKAAKPTTTAYMFDGCAYLNMSMAKLDTSNVTDMSYMFRDCARLTSPGVTKWSTARVKSTASMFSGCIALRTLNLASWNTSQLQDMHGMFSMCSRLTSLTLSKWDTSHVTSMAAAFFQCSALRKLSIGKWDTGRVADMAQLFDQCTSLTSLSIAKWNTSSVERMNLMFNRCASIGKLSLSGWDTSNVANMYCMFKDCASLATLDISGFSTARASGKEARGRLFEGCKALSKVKLGAKFQFAADDATTYLPASTVNGNKTWRSAKEKKRFTAKEIAIRRSGIADTYTK